MSKRVRCANFKQECSGWAGSYSPWQAKCAIVGGGFDFQSRPRFSRVACSPRNSETLENKGLIASRAPNFRNLRESVSGVGSAVEADKKINLGFTPGVNVHGLATTGAATQRRPADVRGDGLYPAGRLPVARLAGYLWFVELGLHPLATLGPKWPVGTVVGSIGPAGRRPTAVSRQQSHQGASRREQPDRGPTKSRHWPHQGWTQYQVERVGRWSRAGFAFGTGTGTGSRRQGGRVCGMAKRQPHNDGGRQRIRQQCLSRLIATVRKPSVYPFPQSATGTSPVASGLLSPPSPDRKLFSTHQTLSPGRHSLRQEPTMFPRVRPLSRHPRLA